MADPLTFKSGQELFSLKNRCPLLKLIQLTFLLFSQQYCLIEAKLSNSLSKIAESDTTVKVWVYFTDKPERPSGNIVSPKAELRRKMADYKQSGDVDYPVASEYLMRVQKCGAQLHNIYKWDNCASFYVHASKLNEIANLPMVKGMQTVRSYKAKYIKPGNGLFKMEIADSQYGLSYNQLNLINVPAAHDYLSRFRNVGDPGNGVMMAVFDAGFRFNHNCFSNLKKNRKIKAMWDFIDNDSTVFDPDSIYKNKNSLNYQNDEHGSTVLSLISGYDPGVFYGTAPGVDLVLARTENGIYDGEFHYEEDNWFSAIVWAESIGVDIVSSSLGYRTDFSDSTIIYRSGDSIPVTDYEYSDLNGKTTIVSRAALFAIERGMIIVNSIGNEGSYTQGTLCAPADVDKVISVGAVNSSGRIAYFSSTGPTADGRIKPDVVAQGVNVTVPVIYGSSDSYSSFANGTSFSTPMIAGVCALIMQSNTGCTADFVRDRLFRFSKLLNENGTTDNYTGLGLPDALLSCMRNNEVYISVKDSLGRPLQYVLIAGENNDSLGMTDKDGKSLISVKPEKLPLTVYLRISGLSKEISIQSTPASKEAVLTVKSGLVVKLLDQKDSTINNGKVFYRIPGIENDFVTATADSIGEAHLVMYREVPVQIYAKATGYYCSDTMNVQICQELCTLNVKLKPISAEKFQLYPSVVKKSRGKALYVEFFPEHEDKESPISNKWVLFSIRSLDGSLLWKKTFYSDSREGVKIKLENELNKMVPGLYYFILENNNKVYRRKFIIAG